MQNKSPITRTISEQLQEIAETICDKYCKHPERYSEDNIDQMYEDVCDSCPLNKVF